VWGNLAFAYEGLKDKEKADKAHDREIALLEEGVQGNPRDAVAQSNLGLLYAKKKLREQAISRIQSALALSPDDTTVLEAVGKPTKTWEIAPRRCSTSKRAYKKVTPLRI